MGRTLMITAAFLAFLAAASTPIMGQSVKAPASPLRSLPPAVCKAIQSFVAEMDTAKSLGDKSRRADAYAQAKANLKAALGGHGEASVFDQATTFAFWTERVADADPSASNFGDLVQNRLQARADLLARCSP